MKILNYSQVSHSFVFIYFFVKKKLNIWTELFARKGPHTDATSDSEVIFDRFPVLTPEVWGFRVESGVENWNDD